jgi:hypothetical protein
VAYSVTVSNLASHSVEDIVPFNRKANDENARCQHDCSESEKRGDHPGFAFLNKAADGLIIGCLPWPLPGLYLWPDIRHR